MRFRQKYPEHYKNTCRISLVSSFFASVFLGKFAHIDISDVTGMNLWHIGRGKWHDGLLDLATEKTGAKELKVKLGEVPEDGGQPMGKVCSYFIDRFGFSPDCDVAPFTGDNPATILALPLQPSDAIVSLGTSTTFLMSTDGEIIPRTNSGYSADNHQNTSQTLRTIS
jgi:xylulokinase